MQSRLWRQPPGAFEWKRWPEMVPPIEKSSGVFALEDDAEPYMTSWTGFGNQAGREDQQKTLGEGLLDEPFHLRRRQDFTGAGRWNLLEALWPSIFAALCTVTRMPRTGFTLKRWESAGESPPFSDLCALISLHVSPSLGCDVRPFRISLLLILHIYLPAWVVMFARAAPK